MNNFKIIDTPWCTTSIIPCLVNNGIETVIRYYGVDSNVHPEKVLRLTEAEALSNAGLNIGVVFEMMNNAPKYFSYDLGLEHAKMAFQLARNINQPFGSAIYFAVDFDASAADINNNIIPHFKGIHDGLSEASNNGQSYKVGIYGSGLVINTVKESYRWLSESMGWSGSKDALNNGEYELYQGPGMSGFCFDDANKFDIDTKKTDTTDIGTFSLNPS